MKTVLIFAHECTPHHRPESTVGAQRPAQFAKHLPAFGWRAIVLCCDRHHRERGTASDFEQLPDLIRQQLRACDPSGSVTIAIPSWPADGLLDGAWRALLPNGRRTSFPREVARKSLTAAKFFTGDYSQPWQPFARRAAETIASLTGIDVAFGEHGPDAGLFLGRWFSQRFGVPWIADFRDPILQPLSPLARRLYEPWARHLLSTASATINVNPHWAALDATQFARPAHCIPNGFDPEEFPVTEGALPNDRFTITYAGNIISQQRLEVFLLGLAELRRAVDQPGIVFKYFGAASQQVARMAAAAGVSALVEANPPVERREAIAELIRADALLVLSVADSQARDVYHRHGLYPAKVFECFGARRPILCVPGDGGQLDELIERTRTGTICRTAQETAAYLADACDGWRSRRSIEYAPDDRRVEEYTRRNLARRLADVLNTYSGAALELDPAFARANG